MAEKEKFFYTVGFPENYARAYVKGDWVCFDIGRRSVGFSCGGQIIKNFSRSYKQNKSFEEFLVELDAVDIITNVLGEERTQKVLDEMWKYLCEA